MARPLRYFDLLPLDLVYEQALFLNIAETEAYSESQRCRLSQDRLWDRKIQGELGIPREYYRDSIMPRKEKFIELKSRTSVEYGSERYLPMAKCLGRAVRLRDRKLAREMVEYFRSNNTRLNNDVVYSLIVEGATARNDEQLLSNNRLGGVIHDYWICGWAEARNLGKVARLLERARGMDVEEFEYTVRLPIVGYAQGGHLDLFRIEEATVMECCDPLIARSVGYAAKYSQWHIVDYILDKYIRDRTTPFAFKKIAAQCYLEELIVRDDLSRFRPAFEELKVILESRPADDFFDPRTLITPIKDAGATGILGYLLDRGHLSINDVDAFGTLEYGHLDMPRFIVRRRVGPS